MAYDDALEDDERDLDTGRDDFEEEDRDEEGGDQPHGSDEGGDDADGGHGPDDGGEGFDEESAEARAARRRAKRKAEKEWRRKSAEHNAEVMRRQAQEIAELRAMVSGIAQRTDMGQLETHLTQATDAYRAAAQKLRTAKEAGDVEAELAAQEEWYGARKRVEDLSALKERVTKQPPQPARPQVNAAKLTAFQESFFDENPWFDRNLRDEDSRAAAALSEKIAAEGYAADTVEHWRELKARLREQMPHRFGGKGAGQQQRQQPGRSPVGGSGGSRGAQPGGNADERRLPREYVQTLKDANLWDDPATRKQMTAEYFASAKRHGV
jgi:hypothetical protein